MGYIYATAGRLRIFVTKINVQRRYEFLRKKNIAGKKTHMLQLAIITAEKLVTNAGDNKATVLSP